MFFSSRKDIFPKSKIHSSRKRLFDTSLWFCLQRLFQFTNRWWKWSTFEVLGFLVCALGSHFIQRWGYSFPTDILSISIPLFFICNIKEWHAADLHLMTMLKPGSHGYLSPSHSDHIQDSIKISSAWAISFIYQCSIMLCCAFCFLEPCYTEPNTARACKDPLCPHIPDLQGHFIKPKLIKKKEERWSTILTSDIVAEKALCHLYFNFQWVYDSVLEGFVADTQ